MFKIEHNILLTPGNWLCGGPHMFLSSSFCVFLHYIPPPSWHGWFSFGFSAPSRPHFSVLLRHLRRWICLANISHGILGLTALNLYYVAVPRLRSFLRTASICFLAIPSVHVLFTCFSIISWVPSFVRCSRPTFLFFRMRLCVDLMHNHISLYMKRILFYTPGVSSGLQK